jgi:ribosomal protein S18 acetylase RimI-like enzyme
MPRHMTEIGPALVCVRRPVLQDQNGIEEMWQRCSAQTRLHRLHSPFPNLPWSYLARVISEPEGSRLATTTDGEVVGLASLLGSGKGAADLGVVVEDQWQRRGIARRMVEELFSEARSRGIRVVKADVLATNAALIRPLRRVDHDLCLTRDGHAIEVTIRLGRDPFVSAMATAPSGHGSRAASVRASPQPGLT